MLVGIDHKDIEAQYKIGDKIQGSRLSIRSADPITQTAVLSDGTKLEVEERMDVYDIPSEKKTPQQTDDFSNQNY